jgi:uncharacterized membrane protein YdjX (TVP38/TMEM64 family)
MAEKPERVEVPTWRRILASRGLQFAGGLAAFAWILHRWLEASGGPEVLTDRYGLLAAAILVPVQAIVAFVPLLGEMIALTNAALYGFWLGALLSWVAWMAASVLQYGVVRRTVSDFDLDATYQRLPRWMRRFPVSHPVFLIGVRIPFGGPIVNTAAGVFRVSLWRHLWCAAVGIAPRAMFFAGLGVGALRI